MPGAVSNLLLFGSPLRLDLIQRYPMINPICLGSKTCRPSSWNHNLKVNTLETKELIQNPTIAVGQLNSIHIPFYHYSIWKMNANDRCNYIICLAATDLGQWDVLKATSSVACRPPRFHAKGLSQVWHHRNHPETRQHLTEAAKVFSNDPPKKRFFEHHVHHLVHSDPRSIPFRQFCISFLWYLQGVTLSPGFAVAIMPGVCYSK